jgi:serine/threonine protein phosphatase PrpC
MEVNSFSDKGKRENNEDFILSQQLTEDCSLFLVADGMGGYSYGEIASSLACESIAEYLITNFGNSEIKQLLSNSLIIANEMIAEKRKELSVKMGTTIAGVLIFGSIAYVFWVGDVRIYHFRNNKINFQSEDHSFINEMKKNGNVSIKEMKRFGNIVTKSLSGVPMEEEHKIIDLFLISGDTLILCTDGFWQKVNVPSISNLPLEDIENLIRRNEYDMEDNYSILKISF